MYFLYSIFLSLAFLACLPYFIYQAFHHKKYWHNFSERLGKLPEALQSDTRVTIWIHAVSVGETLAARALVMALRERFPAHRLIFSTTTATGQATARSRIIEADGFCYFPFDWKFSVRRALNAIRPHAIVLMESELWPNFLQECKQRHIPVLVANGRVSDRSFRRSQKFVFLFRRMTANVTRFLMQSEADAARIIALGAAPEKVSVSGNIKYDIGDEHKDEGLHSQANFLAAELALTQAPLIIAGSTSDGEEEMILAAFTNLKKTVGLENTRLLIAPRHPERFDAVAKMLDSSHFKFVRRSALLAQVEKAGVGNFSTPLSLKNSAHNADVILLDSIGELGALYRYAAVVFVGGSLVPKGGHNILEPAFAGRPIVVGPYMENFREITREFLQRGAVLQLQGASEQELAATLGLALRELLTDKTRAQELGDKARATVEANRGATAKTIAALTNFI